MAFKFITTVMADKLIGIIHLTMLIEGYMKLLQGEDASRGQGLIPLTGIPAQ